MKAAPFDYVRAGSLDETLAALAADGEDAMILAGGQSLVPIMAMRLARPATLIDLNEIADLAGIEAVDGALVIRAMTRQAAALASDKVRGRQPLLAKALGFVGHVQTRNRGTVGGSVAHGDPSAEIPLAAMVLDAEIVLANAKGTRTVPVGAFYDGPLSSVRAADECLTEFRFPAWAEGRIGTGFHEVSPRHGDFAIVAAAVQIAVDDGGVCRRASIAVGGASPNPVRVPAAEAMLAGRRIDGALARDAAAEARAVIDPGDDVHATAAYRRRVAAVLSERAILDAWAEATG